MENVERLHRNSVDLPLFSSSQPSIYKFHLAPSVEYAITGIQNMTKYKMLSLLLETILSPRREVQGTQDFIPAPRGEGPGEFIGRLVLVPVIHLSRVRMPLLMLLWCWIVMRRNAA